MTDRERGIARAEAHVRARLGAGAEPAVTQARGPRGACVVRAARPGAYPGTGVAVAVVTASGQVFGAGLGAELALLLDEVGFDPAAAPDVAELVVLARLDGLFTVLPEPAASLSVTDDGVVLHATIRGALAPEAEQLVVTIPSVGAERVEQRPLAASAEPPAVDRTAALERARRANDAMAIQRALRDMTAPLDERELLAIARVALEARGQLATQARQRLGDGPAAERALATARGEQTGT
jgi:hypothetical protein